MYSLNVNEWKFHSPIEWNSRKPLKKEWFFTLNSKFPLIKSENHSKKSELPLIWGVKRRTTRKRIVLRLTPQTSGNSLFLESFSLYMSGNLLFNVQNHSFLSGLQEFHSFGEWNFHSFTFREYNYTGKSERKQTKKNVKTPMKLYWKIYYRKNIQNTKVIETKQRVKRKRKRRVYW